MSNDALIAKYTHVYRDWMKLEDDCTRTYQEVKETPAYARYLLAKRRAQIAWSRKEELENQLYKTLSAEEFNAVWDAAEQD